MKILIVVEETATGFSAFSPDISGCIATGDTRDEVERSMQEAMSLHVHQLKADGSSVEEPHTYATYIEVAA